MEKAVLSGNEAFARGAWEAGVNRGYMADIEKERTSTGVDIICKLAETLGVEPAELLRGLPRWKR